jgi:hypothetical protein
MSASRQFNRPILNTSPLSSTHTSNTIANIFTNNSNVGIGTTIPAYTLDINGSIQSNNIAYLTSTTSIQGTTNNYSLTSGSLNVSGDIVLSGTELMFTQTNVGPPTLNGRSSGSKIVLYPSQAAATGDFSMGIDFGTMWFQVPLQNHVYRFYHGTTANFNISTGGNVGIGTINPATALHVVQPSGTASMSIQNASSTGNSSLDFFNHSNGYIGSVGFGNTASSSGAAFKNTLFLYHNNQDAVFVGSGTTERMRVTASGNVGIGTTNPISSLTIQGTTSSTIISSNENDTASLFFGTTFQGNLSSGLKAAIISQGKNSYSRSRLHFCLNDAASNSTSNNAAISNSRMMIDSNGQVGIGTTSPSTSLHVNGTIRGNAIEMNGGGGAIQLASGTGPTGSGSGTITFPFTFSNIPKVVASIISSSTTQVFSITVSSVSTTGFTYTKTWIPTGGGTGGAATSESFYWIAMG